MRKGIEVIVRAVVVRGKNILLCKIKIENWYFFPGGRVEFGESARQALARELKEELGVKGVVGRLIGVVENEFTHRRKKYHEINLVFTAKITPKRARSKESHLDFYWVDIAKLKRMKVMPNALKLGLEKWLKTGEVFWGSNMPR